MKSKLKKIIIVLFILWLLIAIFTYFTGNTPLFPAWQWRAKAVTASGKTVPVKVYRMLGQDMPLYLHVGGNDSTVPLCSHPFHEECRGPGFQPPRWFIVFISKDEAWGARKNYPRWFPYLHASVEPDYFEMDLYEEWNGKDGFGEWHLSREGDLVVFSNAVISVTVSKRDSP